MIRDDDALRARIHAALDDLYQPDPGLLRRCVEAVERRGRRAPQLRALAVAAGASLVAVLIVVLTLVQHQLSSGGKGPVQTPAPTPLHAVYTLDAAGTVSALDAATLRPVWRASVGSPSSATDPATLLQLSADARTLWALPLGNRAGGTTLRAFDGATGAAGPSVALSAQGGAAYHALVLDTRTGNLLVVGQDATRILVTVVDSRRAVVLSTRATRTLPTATPVGPDLTLDARLSADGSRLYYSHGGADPAGRGIDWVDVEGATLTPCTPAQPGAACIPGAGLGFQFVGDDLLTADGGNPQRLLELSADGGEVRRFDVGLHAGAVTGVVVDGAQRFATVVGACSDGGGVVRIDLGGGGATQSLRTPDAAGSPAGGGTPCGVRPHLLHDGTLVVSRLDTAAADPNSPGVLAVIDPATGRVLRQATLPAGVIDVIAGP